MNNTKTVASPRGCLARLVSLLHDVKWAMENFGSLHTNTQIPRRKIQSAIQRGYLTSIGMTQPCDATGAALENRQPREGWILTDAGVKFLEANVEHVHHYQRGRASITRLRLESDKIIETERLVVVARCALLGALILLF